jgi:CBS domain-containing protein
MKVRDYLKRMAQQLVTCGVDDTLATAAQMLASKRIGAMPVRGAGGALVGIISERDLVRAMARDPQSLASLRVKDLMTVRVITCSPDDTMTKACQLMNKHNFRHLPVIEDGRIVGVVSIRDGLGYRLQEAELEANVLRDNVIAARHR